MLFGFESGSQTLTNLKTCEAFCVNSVIIIISLFIHLYIYTYKYFET